MTEYDFSPEAYERHIATQNRISNWIDSVSQHTMQTPNTSSRHSSEHQQNRSRPPYHHQHSHSQSQSRSNSLSRSQSRGNYHYHQEPSRPRSHSYSNSRPQPARIYSAPQPLYSRTYSYAMGLPPPPAPVPVPQPISYLHPAPRRSRTLPPQSQNVFYRTYDAPRGGPTYVIVPPAVSGGPHQIHVQSPVRTPHAFLFCRMNMMC
jgi:hypothetical protein